MKRLRATLDVYVDMDDNMTEEEAIGEVNNFIDKVNGNNENIDSGVSMSEIIQSETYNTDDE